MENKITRGDLKELFDWVVSSGDSESKYLDILGQKLREKFGGLPRRIDPEGQTAEFTHDAFVTDVFTRVEYSNPLRFLILNKGRKYLTVLMIALMCFLLGTVFSFGLIFRLAPINTDYVPVLIFVVLGVCIFLEKLNEKVFNRILARMKPGDILRILAAQDEMIPIKVKPSMLNEGSVFSNPPVTVMESKKKLICKEYRKQTAGGPKNLYNLAVYYLATDYLAGIEPNGEVIESFMHQEIDALAYILAFKPGSFAVLSSIAICELNLIMLHESREHFRECAAIRGNDINVNTWLIVLDFLLDPEASGNDTG